MYTPIYFEFVSVDFDDSLTLNKKLNGKIHNQTIKMLSKTFQFVYCCCTNSHCITRLPGYVFIKTCFQRWQTRAPRAVHTQIILENENEHGQVAKVEEYNRDKGLFSLHFNCFMALLFFLLLLLQRTKLRVKVRRRSQGKFSETKEKRCAEGNVCLRVKH